MIKKYLIEIDGVESTYYKYNVWEIWESEDETSNFEKDILIFKSDSKKEFLGFLENL